MSAASSAASQVRRVTAPSAQPAEPRPAVHSPRPQAASFAFVDRGDEVRINLGDIQIRKESMEIEGFKPTLLSRILDLVAPFK